MVTIKDISKKTGYSITTVSKAFNGYSDISEKAKIKILETAQAMGYQPNANARSLVTKRSWTIGVVFQEQTGEGITHAFFGDVLDKFKGYVEKEGFDILFISESLGKKVNCYYDHCLQKGVDGIIILCSYVEDEEIKRLMKSEIPSIVIDHNTDLTNCVYTDSYNCTYNAVKYLIERGHKKIAHIHGDLYVYAGQERFKGYKQALIDYQIPFTDTLLYEGTSYTMSEGYERGMQIARMDDKPTAIVTASDNLAIGVMKAFQENHIKIPDDISIIGFDNINIANIVTPPLTTINQDKEKIAFNAAKCLIQQIDNKIKKYDKIKLEGQLIERETVKTLG